MATKLMAGKRGLIMGLANDKSIAWGIAKALADQGAEIALSYQGEALKKRVEPQSFQLFDFYVNKEWAPEKVASAFNVSVNQVYLAKHRIAELLKAEVARLEQEGN